MTDYETIDVQIPDELPDMSTSYVAKVTKAHFALPPTRKAAKMLGTKKDSLHVAVQPLSFQWKSDIGPGAHQFEDDLTHFWYNLYKADGSLNSGGSYIDRVKKAFKKLGYTITSNQDAAVLVGKIFRFEATAVEFKNWNPGGESEGDGRPRKLDLPVEEFTTYTHTGTVPIRPRGLKSVETGVARIAADDEEAARPLLVELLNGKTEDDWLDAITDSREAAVTRDPFLHEVINDKTAFVARMERYGMTAKAVTTADGEKTMLIRG